MFKNFLLSFLFYFLALGTVAHADDKSQMISFFKNQFSKSDIVILGEWHAISGHKKPIEMVLQTLMENGIVDSFALEGINDTDISTLQTFLSDPEAVPGSKKEDAYLNYLSGLDEANHVRCCWGSILHESYRAIFRIMRVLASNPRLKGKIKFCGIDHNDNYSRMGITKEQDFATLSDEYKQFHAGLYGSFMGWESREFHITENIERCHSGMKKTLVLAGAFHASKQVYEQNGKRFFAAAGLLQEKLKSIKINSGAVVSPPIDDMWAKSESDQGESSPYIKSDFTRNNAFQSFTPTLTSELSESVKTSLKLILSSYDFLIFGPPTEETGGN